MYQIGKPYWLSNATTELPPKSGIGYTTNIIIEWYSSQLFLTFSTIGKKEIEFEFADKMELSSMRMTWIKLIQSNSTSLTNPFNIMIDTSFTIKTNKLEVIEYFKEKYRSDAELNPPQDTLGRNIKSKLELRSIAVSNRRYGGLVIGEFPYPTVITTMTDEQIHEAFKIGFERVLKINKKYIYTEKYTSGGTDKLQIIVFEDEDEFPSLYARLKDEEDPLTGYKSEHKFTKLLENEMRFVQNDLTISFNSWKVESHNNEYAAWYQISVFATLNEINNKVGITIQDAQGYLTAFKESLFDGFPGVTTADIDGPDILRYFNLVENVGYKYKAEMKVTADYVKKIKQIQQDAIASLTEISLDQGWGMVDEHNSMATTSYVK